MKVCMMLALMIMSTVGCGAQVGFGGMDGTVNTSKIDDDPVQRDPALILGLYIPQNDMQFTYSQSGGYPRPGLNPVSKLHIDFYSEGAQATVVTAAGTLKRVCPVAVDSELAARLLTNLFSARLTANKKTGWAVDAGDTYLQVRIGSSDATHVFDGMGDAAYYADKVIDGASLESQLQGIVAAADCNLQIID